VVLGLRTVAGGSRGLSFSLVVDVQDLLADAQGPWYRHRPAKNSFFEASSFTLFEFGSASVAADARQDARPPSRALLPAGGDDARATPAPADGSPSQGSPSHRLSLAGELYIIMR
jgi:hypothetical protein